MKFRNTLKHLNLKEKILNNGAAVRRISRCFTAGAVAILMIAASITGYAWYAKNERLTNEKMMLDLAADDAVASYTVYKYDLIEEKGSTQQELKEQDSSGDWQVVKDGDGNRVMEDITISNIDFNQYDLIFTKRNRYTPVFAHIVITKIATTPDAGKIVLTVTSDSAAGTLTELPENISSVIRFTAVVDGSRSITDELEHAEDFYLHVDELMYHKALLYAGKETHDAGDPIPAEILAQDEKEDIFDGATSFDDASGSFFTNIESSGSGKDISYTYTRSDEVVLELEYDSDAWVEQGEEHDMVLNIYLYMTYDTELISCLTNEQDLQVISIGQNLINFENDLDRLWIQCVE